MRDDLLGHPTITLHPAEFREVTLPSFIPGVIRHELCDCRYPEGCHTLRRRKREWVGLFGWKVYDGPELWKKVVRPNV